MRASASLCTHVCFRAKEGIYGLRPEQLLVTVTVELSRRT